MSRPWKPDWGAYTRRGDHGLQAITVDLNAFEAGPGNDHAVFYWIMFECQAPDQRGLPGSEEREIMNGVRDHAREALARETDTWIVARVYVGGGMFLLFYVRDDVRPVPEVASRGYDAVCHIGYDPEWSLLRALRPTFVELQRLLSVRQVLEMRRHGDVAEARRPVDHFMVFSDEPIDETTRQALEGAGFRIDVTRDVDRATLTFTRDEVMTDKAVLAFSDEVSQLVEGASGAYDGWGAPIVRGAET